MPQTCVLWITLFDGHALWQDGKGAVVFTFLGTDTSKGAKMVKGQMK